MSKKDLTRLFDNAFTIPFDDEDKIVFMSMCIVVMEHITMPY